MGWGSATGLRVIGVATKKSFPAGSAGGPAGLARSTFHSGAPLPGFLSEILICCHRCKNIVPQYSILHYIIEGTAQKPRQLSVGRRRSRKRTRNERQPGSILQSGEFNRVFAPKRSLPSSSAFLSLLGIRPSVSRFRKSFLFSRVGGREIP